MRLASREEVNELNTSEELMIATSGESRENDGGEIVWITDEGEEVVLHEEERSDYIQALAADEDNIYIAGGISNPFIRDLSTGEVIVERPERSVQANPRYSSLSTFEGDLYATFGPNVYNISEQQKVKSDGYPMLEVDDGQLIGCDPARGIVLNILEDDEVDRLMDEDQFRDSITDYQPGEETFFIRRDKNENCYFLESESEGIQAEGEHLDNLAKVGSSLYYSAVEGDETVIYRHPDEEIFRTEYGRNTKISDIASVDRDIVDDLRGEL